jgi:integrase
VSEILALQWQDIHFDDLTLRVTRAVVDGVVDEVKTEYSEDHLPLDPDLATALLHWNGDAQSRRKAGYFPALSLAVVTTRVQFSRITFALRPTIGSENERAAEAALERFSLEGQSALFCPFL